MNNGTLVLSDGKANVYRSEQYNHRTTASVEWVIVYTQSNGLNVIVQRCKTKRDAIVWAKIYKV